MVPPSKLNSLSPLAQTFNCKRSRMLSGCLTPGALLLARIPSSYLLNVLVLDVPGLHRHGPHGRSFPLYLSILGLSPSLPKTPATASPPVIGRLSLIQGFWALRTCQTPPLEFPLASWHANPSRWSIFKACFFPQTLWGFNQILIQKSQYKKGSWDNENES